ncbi:MAG: GatB/YqeY domain-containing protein [Bacteroidota bacterium]|nr:GatB/YqeY domain-containing protein [Bacteroidota bacterium]
MSLEAKVMESLKEAMRNKDEAGLRALRAIKSSILLAKTEEGASDFLTTEQEDKLLNKLAKQRRESIDIYHKQNRPDLAEGEEAELRVLEKFLPEQMSDDDVKAIIHRLIQENEIENAGQIGRLMPLAMKELNGKADGKKIQEIARDLLA